MRSNNVLEWDDETTTKFVSLLRKKKIFWCKKYSDSNKRLLDEAVHYIKEKMRPSNITITLRLIIEKINHLKKLYSLEIQRIRSDSLYKPNKTWFPVFKEIMSMKNQYEKGGNGDINISEVEYSSHSAFTCSTETEHEPKIEGTFEDDLPTQPNININIESVNPSYGISLGREDVHFSSSEPSLVEEYDNDVPSNRPDEILVSFGNYLVSLLKRLSVDRSNQLQLEFIAEAMNLTTHHVTVQREDESSTSGKRNDTQNSLVLPLSDHGDVLVTFGNYLVSLLKRLPIDRSNQLQEKFISQTMNATALYEKERHQLSKKRKSAVEHDRQSITKESRLDRTRVSGFPNEGLKSKTNISSAGNQFVETQQQKKQCNSLRSNGIAGARRLAHPHSTSALERSTCTNQRTALAWNKSTDLPDVRHQNTITIPDISIEVGPEVEEIKQELDFPFDTAMNS